MKYLNASCIQRFIAYLVDYALISMFLSFILAFIPAYNECSKVVTYFYTEYLHGNVSTDLQDLTFVLKNAMAMIGVKLFCQVPIYVLYLIVLPLFWDKQTIGRLLMHVKVVSKAEEKATIKNLLLRELIGGLLLDLFSGSVILPIVYWYLSATTGRSLADMIGGTRLINTRFIRQEYETFEEKDTTDMDYVDATFRELPSEDEHPEEPKEEETDYRIF